MVKGNKSHIILPLLLLLAFTPMILIAQQKSAKVYDKPAIISSPVIPTDIFMHRYYPARIISKSATPYTIPKLLSSYKALENTPFILNGKKTTIQQYLKNSETAALLVIKNDTLRVEKYYTLNGFSFDSSAVFPSFSVAKSIVSSLVGMAINEGLIKSLDEPITSYISGIPVNKGFEKIKIKHLLQMTSGIRFNEEAGVSTDLSNLYQVADLKEYLRHIGIQTAPGKEFSYKSIDTQLLGFIISKASGTSLSQYLKDKLWEPLGMEYDASWSIDKIGGAERAYSCINARAIDFAKIGMLYLHNGKWQGKQLIPEQWIQSSIHADQSEGGSSFYKYQWWLFGGLLGDSHTDYAAIGILGQFIYVNPEKQLVIVKFSNKKTDYKTDYLALRAIIHEM